MGYLTSFRLTVEVPNAYEKTERDIIADFRARNEDAEYALEPDGSASDSCKWYFAPSDLQEFSKSHPAAVFTLYGEGEETGDLWRAYVKNGELVEAKAEISFAPNPYRPGLSGGGAP